MTAGRLLAYLGLAVLGTAVGVAGSLVQAAWFPGGLVLALAAVGALCYGAGVATASRGAGLSAAGGWLLAVIALSTSRPEGDFFFAAQLGPQVFLFGGMLVAVICTTLPGRGTMGPPEGRLPG